MSRLCLYLSLFLFLISLSPAQAWDPYVSPSVLDDPMSLGNIQKRIDAESQQRKIDELEQKQRRTEEDARERRKETESSTREQSRGGCLSDACLRRSAEQSPFPY